MLGCRSHGLDVLGERDLAAGNCSPEDPSLSAASLLFAAE
jgi:hypothetical protein